MYIRRSVHTIFIFEKTGKALKHACIERMKEEKEKEREREKVKRDKFHIRLSEGMSVYPDLSFFTGFVHRDSNGFSYQECQCTYPVTLSLLHDVTENAVKSAEDHGNHRDGYTDTINLCQVWSKKSALIFCLKIARQLSKIANSWRKRVRPSLCVGEPV